jgi:hypothetical protein
METNMQQDKCDHNLVAHTNTLLKDGRNPLVVYCTKCARQWNCESINFAPMGDQPEYFPRDTD